MTKLTLLTQSAVLAQIAVIGATAKTLQTDIHVCAVSTLDHVRVHGDTRGVVALLNALPNGQRVKGLAAWYRSFSNGKLTLKPNKDSKEWEATLSKDRVDADFNMDGAEETDYGSFTVEVAPQTLTLDKMLKKIEGFSTNDEKNADGSPKVDDAARAMAAELVAFTRKTIAAKLAA